MIKSWIEYSSINENLQKAKSILRRLNISEDNLEFKKLRELLKNNTGYIGKFTQWMFVNKNSYEELENLFNILKSSKLSKPIDEFETIDEIIKTVSGNKVTTTINQIINSIPSNARQFLMKGYCYECDNEGLVECKECGGDATISCDECRYGSIKCDECNGDGVHTCSKCNGDGLISCKDCKRKKNKQNCETCYGAEEIECDGCNGSGELYCSKCNGDGEFDCKKCEGSGDLNCTKCNDGYIKCEECSKPNKHWDEFLNFLESKIEHKELIVNFLSKKSARFVNEYDYDSNYDSLNDLKNAINMIVNLPSIDKISSTIKDDPNARLIYDDDKILIIAVNWDGLQKYGSSYWCITDDENTYDGYIGDNCQQWVVFFKDKTPFIDDNSIMGITYKFDSAYVKNAHWEDDDECLYHARKLVDNIKLDIKKIIKAFEIYSDFDISSVLFRYPNHFKSNIEDLVVKNKEYCEEVAKFKESLIGRKGRKPNIPRDLNDRYNSLIEYIAKYDDNNAWNDEVSNIINNKCKEINHKIEIDKSYIPVVLNTNIYKSCIIKDLNFDIFNEFHIDDDMIIDILKWLISIGYKLKDYTNSGNALLLYDLGVIDITTLIENYNNWRYIDGDDKYLTNLSDKLLSNIDNIDKNKLNINMFMFICDTIKNNNKLIKKHKSSIIDIINNSPKITPKILISILDDFDDDDDIEMACARKLIHKKISSKYDIDIKRKMLERLMYFDKFKKS